MLEWLDKPWIRGPGKAVMEIGKRWWKHNHGRSAAALAFLSLFSLVPILVASTALAAMLIGKEQAKEEVEGASALFLDADSSNYLLHLLEEQNDPVLSGWASVFGFMVLLFVASRVVVELRDVLETIFGKKRREGRKEMVIAFVMGRAVPVLLIISLGLVLALSAALGTVLQVVAEGIESYIPSGLGIWNMLQASVSLVIVTLLFALILRWLPPKPPGFMPALGGALVACALLAGLRGVIGLYFQSAGVTTFYGAAVTLVVVLLWIYFTIQIFFVGAETAAYLDRKKRGGESG